MDTNATEIRAMIQKMRGTEGSPQFNSRILDILDRLAIMAAKSSDRMPDEGIRAA